MNLPTSKDADRKKDKAAAPAGNKGFAYVDFATFEAAVAALALSETDLGGRKLLIKDSKSFAGRPDKKKEPEAGAAAKDAGPASPQSSKIFVGNLGFAVDQDAVRAHFEKCGAIESVKVATFEDSGKCKGYGWVRFKEPAAAGWAVKGFVKLKEDVPTEDDIVDDGQDAEDDDNGRDSEKRPQGKTKTRKWWVNRLMGRALNIQFAEDDQVRYRKRFGKDAPQNKSKEGEQGAADAAAAATAGETAGAGAE